MREEFFQSAVLDMGVLSIAIVNCSDVSVDRVHFLQLSKGRIPRVDTVAAWISWQSQQKRVISSCVVWAI